MWKPKVLDGRYPDLSNKVKFYTHTGILGPYNPTTNSFTVYDSNMRAQPPHGIGSGKLILRDVKVMKYLDLFDYKK